MPATTTDALSKKLMQECRTSGLALLDQATALGTAYACYLMTKGVTRADLHLVTVDLDRAVVTKIEIGLNEKRVREHFAKQNLAQSEIYNRITAVRKKPV